MDKKRIAQAVSNNLAWLATMRQPKGYGGPVVHYWGNSLRFIGPGIDWRYEGLVSAGIALHQKTGQSVFWDFVLTCGQDILKNQMASGAFLNSAFEANPSLGYSGQPHECAVDIALLSVAEHLGKKNKTGNQAGKAAEKNISSILMPKFWNEKKRSFQQYAKGQWDLAPNLFVPNKIATACEALVKLYHWTDHAEWLENAGNAAEVILEEQVASGKQKGGIFQANDQKQIITFYTARCIVPLLLLEKETGENRFGQAARKAAAFVARQQLEDGSFSFGFMEEKDAFFPILIGGAGDILRGLQAVNGFESEVEQGTAFLLFHQHATGGFWSFRGLRKQPDTGLPSWWDLLPVVGWNDKALRFLVSQVDEELPSSSARLDMEVACREGTLIESSKTILVRGQEEWVFEKQGFFSNQDPLRLKQFFYWTANTTIPVLHSGGRFLARLVGAR